MFFTAKTFKWQQVYVAGKEMFVDTVGVMVSDFCEQLLRSEATVIS